MEERRFWHCLVDERTASNEVRSVAVIEGRGMFEGRLRSGAREAACREWIISEHCARSSPRQLTRRGLLRARQGDLLARRKGQSLLSDPVSRARRLPIGYDPLAEVVRIAKDLRSNGRVSLVRGCERKRQAATHPGSRTLLPTLWS